MVAMKNSVIKTECFPKAYTISRDGQTPISNGDWSLWFETHQEAQAKADSMNQTDNEQPQPPHAYTA